MNQLPGWRALGKHVRACIVYTWDHKSSQSFWAGMKVWVGDVGYFDGASQLSIGRILGWQRSSIHRQPILADEVQTFKALITIHKVLQEGHPIAVKEAQPNTNWLESLTRGISEDGIRGWNRPTSGATTRFLILHLGYGPLLREYVYFLLAKLAFHRQHPEFNGKLWGKHGEMTI